MDDLRIVPEKALARLGRRVSVARPWGRVRSGESWTDTELRLAANPSYWRRAHLTWSIMFPHAESTMGERPKLRRGETEMVEPTHTRCSGISPSRSIATRTSVSFPD